MAQSLKLRLCKVISTTLQSCASTDADPNPPRSIHFSLPNNPKPPAADVINDFEWRKDDKWHVIGRTPHHKNKNKNRKQRNKKQRRRVRASSSSADSGCETEEESRLSVFKRLIPCVVDGKVKESFAVVKRSDDPYEDFKKSMMEMIVEKEMFEQRDLEQLLQCFLSLNSRCYHGIIVQAFSHIWDTVFNCV